MKIVHSYVGGILFKTFQYNKCNVKTRNKITTKTQAKNKGSYTM